MSNTQDLSRETTWTMRQIGVFLAAVVVLLSVGQVVMDLKQRGAEVTGNVVVTGPSTNRTTTMQATVSGNQRSLKGRVPGTLTVTGDTMSGVVYGVVEANVTLKRQ